MKMIGRLRSRNWASVSSSRSAPAENRSSPSATRYEWRLLPAWWRMKTSRMLRSSVVVPSTAPGPMSSSSCMSSWSSVSLLGFSQLTDAVA